MVVEVSDRKEKFIFYYASVAPPFFAIYFLLFTCCYAMERWCCYQVCSLVGWLDVISTVLLQVFLSQRCCLTNSSLSLSLVLFLSLFPSLSLSPLSQLRPRFLSFALVAVLELEFNSVQNYVPRASDSNKFYVPCEISDDFSKEVLN